MSNQEREEQLLYEMMPHIATQVRLSLAGIYVAAARLAPAEERARDPELDKNAAMLLQGYFRLLRLANELDAAPLLASSAPLPTQNTELVEWVNSLVMEAQPLFELQGVKRPCSAPCEATWRRCIDRICGGRCGSCWATR